MDNYLKLQPVKGKYLKITWEGKVYEIYKVDPRTNEFGTRVSRQDAIMLLETCPGLITLVQQIKDGKIVKQISDDEIARIHQNQLDRKLGMAPTESVPENSAGNPELEKLVKSQSKMIEEQAKAIKILQDQLKEITKNSEKASSTKEKGEEKK